VREHDLSVVLGAFADATLCAAAVWTQSDGLSPLTLLGAAPTRYPAVAPQLSELPIGPDASRLKTSGGDALAARLPPVKRAWLVVGPYVGIAPPTSETAGPPVRATPSRGLSRLTPPSSIPAPPVPLERLLAFLAPVVSQILQTALEVEHAASELAERYEEINLLYTISEILGRTVRLDEAASTILTEISETVGARRGSILVHDRVTDTLQVVAAQGVQGAEVPPIAVDDACSVSARVFRTRHPAIVEQDDAACEAEAPYRRGAMLSVPIMWTNPDGGEPLGVVNLSDRRSGAPFTAGDQKLVAAIATQIGTAIQNTRLVRASLAQQRLVQEMELAHDLQMKLLPAAAIVAPEAEVAARVVPAESVGGDFYNLFRLGHGCTGGLLGDVSSHGYRAALIMALAMSASAIHAQATMDPGAMLGAVLSSLREELASTEMFIAVFYGVVDRERGKLHYANAGHPHAFVIGADGAVQRLPALDPPLGMVDGPPTSAVREWARGSDVLLVFTDGISDARNRADERLGERAVLDTVVQHRTRPVAEIVERVFETLAQHTGDLPPRDDLTLVVLRS
jgi:phosphoserine phosphatase RsbU/P